MKKTYISPTTEITLCGAFQLMAGSGKASLNAQGHDPINDTGEGDMSDFINRTNLWDED